MERYLEGKAVYIYMYICIYGGTHFYLDSLNSNDLPRHFISMEEDTVLVCRKAPH